VRETLAVAPLIVMIFVIGFFPSIFLDRMKDAVTLEYNQFKTVSEQAIRFSDENNAQMLPADDFAPEFLRGAPGIKEEQPAEGDEQARGEGEDQ
jgi:NADH-quinone oxidoreductase subunit M